MNVSQLKCSVVEWLMLRSNPCRITTHAGNRSYIPSVLFLARPKIKIVYSVNGKARGENFLLGVRIAGYKYLPLKNRSREIIGCEK